MQKCMLRLTAFSQWVLELQEGHLVLGTSLAGVVLLQSVLSRDLCVAVPFATSQPEDVSQ